MPSRSMFAMLLSVLVCMLSAGAGRAQETPATPAARAVSATPSPEPVIREFLRALYSHDTAAYLATVVDRGGAEELIGSNPLSEEDRASIQAEAAEADLRQSGPATLAGAWLAEPPFPVGARVVYTTGFRGTLLAIPVVHTAAGWKVEVRYWLEMKHNQDTRLAADDPRVMAKGFLFHALGNVPEELAQFSAGPIVADAIGIPNGLPGGDLDQILSLCLEMPVVEARPGETHRLPSGTKVTQGEKPGERLFVGLMGPVEVPFLLRQVEGQWKVVPQNYFVFLRALGAI